MRNKVKLIDLCTASGKYGIAASAEEFDVTKYRYLRITDISDDGELLNNDCKSVSCDGCENYLLEENDIVFARTGNSTGRSFLYEKKYGELIWAGFLIKFNLDPEKVNPKFMKYYTISSIYKDWINSGPDGSTRGNMNEKDFAKMPIFLPERPEQDAIVEVIEPISEKIELNKKIMEELKQGIQILFEYWFYQYEFPDALGKAYKSNNGEMDDVSPEKKKPVVFKKMTIADITENVTEKVLPTDYAEKLFLHYSIPEFDKSGTYAVEKGQDIQSDKTVVKPTHIMVSKLNPWFNRVVLPVDELDTIASTEFIVWDVKNSYIRNFLYALVSNRKFISYCTQKATGTSNSHKRVTPDLMQAFPFWANESVIEEFGKRIGSSVDMIKGIIEENKELLELRKNLLNVLITGQAHK